MIDIYGTIGPSCKDDNILREMYCEGMTGIRINTSHRSVSESKEKIIKIKTIAHEQNVNTKLLIDLQGPEMRVGKLDTPLSLKDGSVVEFTVEKEKKNAIPVSSQINEIIKKVSRIRLDDGKIELERKSGETFQVIRGGILLSSKSISMPGEHIHLPALTDQDLENIRDGIELGITGVMQPFVGLKEDLLEVRSALNKAGGMNVKIYAKIENQEGVDHLPEFMDVADEIVIARGDLGSNISLWELPRLQKQIARKCKEKNMPFMVVTQMLASMEQNPVPTRAEVSDVYNAVCDGASSVMVTGETAVGMYPIEVIKFLKRIIQTYCG